MYFLTRIRKQVHVSVTIKEKCCYKPTDKMNLYKCWNKLKKLLYETRTSWSMEIFLYSDWSSECIFERESFCQRLNVIGVTDNLNIVIDGRAVINKPIDFTTKSTWWWRKWIVVTDCIDCLSRRAGLLPDMGVHYKKFFIL